MTESAPCFFCVVVYELLFITVQSWFLGFIPQLFLHAAIAAFSEATMDVQHIKWREFPGAVSLDIIPC